MKRNHFTSRAMVALCSFILAVAGIAFPSMAAAQEGSNVEQLQTEATELATKIEATTTAYLEAEEAVQNLEDQIAQNEARSAEIESQLPEQRERTAQSVKSMYMFQQSSSNLLELILSAESFEDFLTTLSYLDIIHERNTEEINNLTALVSELAQTTAELAVERDEAVQKQQDALAALEEARDARAELQAHAVSVALSEQGDREAAIKAAQEALATVDNATFVTSSGNTATVSVPEGSSVSTEPLTSNITTQETGDWASRINEYLKGSPLEGYGEAFASAATKYGVDPRLSPAIATIESGKGTYCFKDYNAWGWGSSGFDSWEAAIDEQVQGLAAGYDGTLTLEGAERYCPPNYQEWYSSVANEMDSI